DMIAELLAYAENGGSLLLVGPGTCGIFGKYLHSTPDTVNRTEQWRWVSLDHEEVGMLKNAHDIQADGAETVVWFGDQEKETTASGGVILPWGKGKIGMLAADIGWQYGDCVQFIHRNILRALCDRLYTPLVKLEKAVGIVEMTALRKNGRLYVQLINGNGGHAGTNFATEDCIPPALDIALTIRLDKKPAALVLQPAGKALDFTWADGIASVTVDRVDIHEIVEVIE
ncbi:MAG: hypothetical protein IKY52_02070, partial [Clostridia bacterium]|nr:hypothetical protein [Clostridia bacterium]